MSTPTTFEAHGHRWTKHTPGDSNPCQSCGSLIVVLFKDGTLSKMRPAGSWLWSLNSSRAIIGWRYADATPPQEKDELTEAIQKLTSTPGISAESLALIEAAKVVQSGSMTFAEALATLSPFTESK